MEYYTKEGWQLNPDEKIVKGITRIIERNDGLCPCTHSNTNGDLHCPCESYRLKDKCYCNLYIKVNEFQNEEDKR